MSDNEDSGYDAPLTISGSEVTGVLSRGDDEAVVMLASGATATIPSSDQDYTRALELDDLQPAPPSPPDFVSNAQARAALRGAGLIAAVDAAITAAGNASIRDAWEYSPFIHRSSTLVATLGSALSLTAPQIDALFAAASAIEF